MKSKVLPFLLFLAVPLWAQETAGSDEQISFVGMTLAEVIERFGTPRGVLPARGVEIWQDDVVFHYEQGDFYIFRDRVWQVKFSYLLGISLGDPKSAVLLVLGDTAEDNGEYVLSPVSGGNWPLMLRVNFNNSGRAAEIFLYRPDF